MPDETFPLRTLLRAFPGIPVDEARALIRSSVVKSYPEGAVLCKEDAYETTFYILLDGQVQVTKKVDPAGREVRLLSTLGPGDFFGEMALIQDAPRAATVTAVTSTHLLEIHKEDFDEMVSASPSLSRALIQEVANRLRSNDAMAIEDLRLKARELATAYQRLAEQDYARREFVTTVANELRTPLTAADNFLRTLEQDAAQETPLDNAALRANLRTASRHIEHIVALVNDILFVQEMELILPRFAPVDLGVLVRAAVDSTHTRQRENRVQVHVDLPADLPTIAGDAASLQRALAALVDNAVKFSHAGGAVDVCVGEQDGRVWVEVRDRGVGITEAVAPRIFERFFHMEQIGDRRFSGAGLGLSIARQVIEQHQGQITVDSHAGEGTTVRMELPVSQNA